MLDALINALNVALGNQLLVAVVLAMLPISEVRGAAIYAFLIGQHWLLVPAALANMAVAPLILFLWNMVNVPWWGGRILGKRLEAKLLSFGRRYERLGLLALITYVAIPFPLTGVWTATLLAELFGVRRRLTLFASAVGVVIAALVMYAILSQVIKFA